MPTAELPKKGDRFPDIASPGWEWVVEDVGETHVTVNVSNGQTKGGSLRWPKDRWQAFLLKQVRP